MSRARAFLTVIALTATLLTGTACESRADQCRRDGGTVEKEAETKVKNGKIKTVTEYECIAPDGTELYEWK